MRWKSSISNSLASSHLRLTLSETNPDLAPTPAAAFIVFSFPIDIDPPFLSCAFGLVRARFPHPSLGAHGSSTARSDASRNHDAFVRSQDKEREKRGHARKDQAKPENSDACFHREASFLSDRGRSWQPQPARNRRSQTHW